MVKSPMLHGIDKNDVANESEAYLEIFERECDGGNSQHDSELFQTLSIRHQKDPAGTTHADIVQETMRNHETVTVLPRG